MNYLTCLPNIDIWCFSPPKDLTCNNYVTISIIECISSFNYYVIYRGEKEKSVAKYWLRTYSTNSRKCFCHTIRYQCLGQPVSFKNGHSWSLVHSFRILITVNRRKRKIKQTMTSKFFSKLPHTEQEVTKSTRGERRK